MMIRYFVSYIHEYKGNIGITYSTVESIHKIKTIDDIDNIKNAIMKKNNYEKVIILNIQKMPI